MNKTSHEDTKKELLLETASIPWHELQYFFAGGKAIFVDSNLDLIEVAHQFAQNNKQAVDQWIKNEKVMPVPDNVARTWYESNANVWAVVVKPWVLVQQVIRDE